MSDSPAEQKTVPPPLKFEAMWKASVQDWKDEQAKVAELVREVAELDATQRKFGTLQHELLTRAEAAEARAAALEADARRYRWLREQDWFDGAMCVVRDPKSALTSGRGLGADCPARNRLDDAIDTVISQESGGSSPEELHGPCDHDRPAPDGLSEDPFTYWRRSMRASFKDWEGGVFLFDSLGRTYRVGGAPQDDQGKPPNAAVHPDREARISDDATG